MSTLTILPLNQLLRSTIGENQTAVVVVLGIGMLTVGTAIFAFILIVFVD